MDERHGFGVVGGAVSEAASVDWVALGFFWHPS